MYRLLDLFSGIGGFSLGLERSGGFRTVAFCEIDPYCRKVLAKHWPKVPQYDDVRALTADRLAADGIGVDAICGGFPCQDISVAGKGAGIEGERSGLWSEYARIIGELRPRYVIVENVSALLGRGLDRVLGDLASLRYDAEWHCIPASAVGAPHRRDRLWLVAHAHSCRPLEPINASECSARMGAEQFAWDCRQFMAYTGNKRREEFHIATGSGQLGQHTGRIAADGLSLWWATEPDVGRVADGVPNRAHRLRALGNAVVPQIPELIGRAILAAERTHAPSP